MNHSKIFVGNLPFSTRSSDLETLFSPFGEIIGINIREDRDTGRPRGFAFVTFSEEFSAEESIKALNGFEYCGRILTVNLATARGSENQRSVDQSWKTAPPPRNGNNKNQNNNQTQNKKKSWTSWTSLPKLSISTTTTSSSTTTTTTKTTKEVENA